MAASTIPQTTSRPGCEFLTVKQIANRYGIHEATIHRWVKAKRFPAPIRLGENCTRWRLADLESWEEKQREVS